MTSLRYDKLLMSTTIPNFINLPTATFGITCSGIVANGSTLNFPGSISINNFSTFNDIKATNISTNKTTYLTNGYSIDPIFQYVADETVTVSVKFIGTLVSVNIAVSNFGMFANITLTSQTFNIRVIGYKLPF